MMRPIAGLILRNKRVSKITRAAHTLNTNKEWVLFPREHEGNNYNVNYSLVEDGVTAVGDAYRNARVPLLATKIGSKINDGIIENTTPTFFGAYDVVEAGDTISHDDFANSFSIMSDHLSSGQELFVEDGGLGAHNKTRLGTRVTTENPALALVMRKLLITIPPREVDHKARFKGWNLDERWNTIEQEWKGDHYLLTETQTEPKPAQRSILTFVGDDNDKVAVQFVEKNKEIVGANIVAGLKVPVRGLIDAMGHAATVLVNEANENALALPSLVLTKGADTVVVVGADDALVAAYAANGKAPTYELFGAYHNVLSPEGVSALWNGYIGAIGSSGGTQLDEVPVLKVGGNGAHALVPNNLASAATRVIFYERGAAKGKLSADEGVKRALDVSDESKELLAKSLFKKVELHVAGSLEDIASLLK